MAETRMVRIGAVWCWTLGHRWWREEWRGGLFGKTCVRCKAWEAEKQPIALDVRLVEMPVNAFAFDAIHIMLNGGKCEECGEPKCDYCCGDRKNWAHCVCVHREGCRDRQG